MTSLSKKIFNQNYLMKIANKLFTSTRKQRSLRLLKYVKGRKIQRKPAKTVLGF